MDFMALDKSTSLTTDHGTYWLFYFQYIREDLIQTRSSSVKSTVKTQRNKQKSTSAQVRESSIIMAKLVIPVDWRQQRFTQCD